MEFQALFPSGASWSTSKAIKNLIKSVYSFLIQTKTIRFSPNIYHPHSFGYENIQYSMNKLNIQSVLLNIRHFIMYLWERALFHRNIPKKTQCLQQSEMYFMYFMASNVWCFRYNVFGCIVESQIYWNVIWGNHWNAIPQHFSFIYKLIIFVWFYILKYKSNN